MPKFRKKPVVIVAHQWHEGEPWVEGMVISTNVNDFSGKPVILTLEGEMKVTSGDYIITGVKGERYPCKPDIFETTYDLVDEPKEAGETINIAGEDIPVI